MGGGVKYVGDRYAGDNEAVALGDYTTVDLMAAYTMVVIKSKPMLITCLMRNTLSARQMVPVA